MYIKNRKFIQKCLTLIDPVDDLPENLWKNMSDNKENFSA